jgi:hypothetical protein
MATVNTETLIGELSSVMSEYAGRGLGGALRFALKETGIALVRDASAGETRRAETTQIGSVEDEHAVPKGDAQPNPSDDGTAP